MRPWEVDVRPLFSERFDLSVGIEALAQAPGVLKVPLDAGRV